MAKSDIRPAKHAHNRKDVTGQKYGKLTCVCRERTSEPPRYESLWRWRCDCGDEVIKPLGPIRAGKIISCGCASFDDGITSVCQEFLITRGVVKKIRERWSGMKQRCHNPNDSAYGWYGARGIQVCESWRDNFVEFLRWALSNGYSNGLSIDRINNDKGYAPDNCRWASRKIQQSNMRSNQTITFNGETHTYTDWALKLGLSRSAISTRIRVAGMTPEEAVTTPASPRGRHAARHAKS